MTVAVVEKIFLLLETLAQARTPISLKEVAETTRLPKPTAYRLLRTLQTLGYVVRHGDDNHYALGHRIQMLATAPAHQKLKEAARPLMERLHRAVNETVNLGVREGDMVRYIDYIETTRALRMVVRPGQSDSLFSTALGRAILSAVPEAEAAEVLKANQLKSIRPASMRALLQLAREDGWAEEREETTIGVGCIAIPLHVLGHADAAVSVSLPIARFDRTCRRTVETIFREFYDEHKPASQALRVREFAGAVRAGKKINRRRR
jgi:DNA-binding IclR family transcriptional regulator